MNSLLEVKDIKKYFPIRTGILRRIRNYLKAVDGVSFSVKEKEIFGLVGESGCGKSTVARLILRLINPTSGEIFFRGEKIDQLDSGKMKRLRRDMQIIFQDPLSSLNPRMTIQRIIERPVKIYGLLDSEKPRDQILSLLEKVGLTDEHLDCHPHELSGGQQQRVGIARALSLSPRLLFLDEPTSALDVSIQSQIINLLMQLHDEFSLSYVFISHNLSLVRFMSQRVANMYLGKVVELADKKELFEHPAHPYTQALLSAIPQLTHRGGKTRIILQGSTPIPIDLPPGCRFRTRCFQSHKKCEEEPELREIATRHYVACHLFG